jgi:probable HAF family extracellular repeat protein
MLRSLRNVSLVGAALLTLAAGARLAAAQAQTPDAPRAYALQDIGGLGGSHSWATAINRQGHVIGFATTEGDEGGFPYVWKDGVMTPLTLGGTSGEARGINDEGHVFGLEPLPEGQRGFFWNGAIQDLGSLGGSYTYPMAMNNAGRVVGGSTLAGDTSGQAFLWDPVGGMQSLGTPDEIGSGAHQINNRGQVAGVSVRQDGTQVGFLWDPVGGRRDLGTLGGPFGYILGLNEQGKVIGTCQTSNSYYESQSLAFVSEGGVMKPLSLDSPYPGGDYSYPVAINNQGQVIGDSWVPGGMHAFFWDPETGIHDIGTLGRLSSYARAINENGQVVGASLTHGGAEHAFLWDPVRGMRDIHPPGVYGSSGAVAINIQGQVLLEVWDDSGQRTMVWQNGVATELGTLGGSSSFIAGINDQGLIAGSSYIQGDVALHSLIARPKRAIVTTVTVPPSVVPGLPHVTFTARVNAGTATGPAVAGQVVEFTLPWRTEVVTATTNANGVASVMEAIPLNFPAGSHPLTASTPGNATDQPSTGSAQLTVKKAATRMYSSDTHPSGFTATVTLERNLDPNGSIWGAWQPLPGQGVIFSVLYQEQQSRKEHLTTTDATTGADGKVTFGFPSSITVDGRRFLAIKWGANYPENNSYVSCGTSATVTTGPAVRREPPMR